VADALAIHLIQSPANPMERLQSFRSKGSCEAFHPFQPFYRPKRLKCLCKGAQLDGELNLIPPFGWNGDITPCPA
jgi:hypothetical protein